MKNVLRPAFGLRRSSDVFVSDPFSENGSMMTKFRSFTLIGLLGTVLLLLGLPAPAPAYTQGDAAAWLQYVLSYETGSGYYLALAKTKRTQTANNLLVANQLYIDKFATMNPGQRTTAQGFISAAMTSIQDGSDLITGTIDAPTSAQFYYDLGWDFYNISVNYYEGSGGLPQNFDECVRLCGIAVADFSTCTDLSNAAIAKFATAQAAIDNVTAFLNGI